MAAQIVRIQRAGGEPKVEVHFGYANIGVCRMYRWRPGQAAVEISSNGMGPVAELEGAQVSYEAIIESPLEGAGQPYSISVEILQDGQVAGVSRQNGALNADGAKSVWGLFSFELV